MKFFIIFFHIYRRANFHFLEVSGKNNKKNDNNNINTVKNDEEMDFQIF